MNGVVVANQEEAASVAAEFLSSLDNLPNEVQHLLTEIKHKDAKATEIQAEINKDTQKYIKHALKASSKDAVGGAGATSSGGGTPTPGSGGTASTSTPTAPPPSTGGNSAAPPTTAASTATTNSTTTTKEPTAKETKDALIPARVAENYALLDAIHLERIALAQRLVDSLARVGARLEHDLARVVQLSGESAPQETYVVQGGYVVGTIPAGTSATSAATATSGGVNVNVASQHAVATAAAAASVTMPPVVNVAAQVPAPAPASVVVSGSVSGGLPPHMSNQMPLSMASMGGMGGMALGAGGTLPLGPPATLAAMGLAGRGGPMEKLKIVESLRAAAAGNLGIGAGGMAAGGGDNVANKRRRIGTGTSSRAHTPQARGSRLALSSSARASPHPPSSGANAASAGVASAGSGASYRRRAAPSRKGMMVTDDELEDRDEDGDAEGDEDDEEGDEGEGDSEDQRPYCFCQKTSYGEMVACDNAKCPYQWFHLGCVGLAGKPLPDTFFCEECLRNGAGGAGIMGGIEGAGGGGGGRKGRRKGLL